jgi:hypothetical protein
VHRAGDLTPRRPYEAGRGNAPTTHDPEARRTQTGSMVPAAAAGQLHRLVTRCHPIPQEVPSSETPRVDKFWREVEASRVSGGSPSPHNEELLGD